MTERLPLETLIKLTRERTDEAARMLGALQSQRSQAHQQLDMLHAYRQDYLARMQRAMQSGMAAADCHNYQRFIGTLDTAIAQQIQALNQADDRVARSRQHWQQQKRRLNAFDALSERQARTERLATNRREQRQTDEHAARSARHAPAGY